MVGQTAAGFAPVERVWRVVKLTVVALIAAAAIALVAADDANAMADSDGYVPVSYVCYATNDMGFYDWYYDGYAVYGYITLNTCAMDRLGAGPNDRARVLAHEQGHAAGLPHSSDPNSVMYPVYYVTGT